MSSIFWTPSISTLGHGISYTVTYSYDDGITWIFLIVDTTLTSFEWDISTVNDGTYNVVKVSASDSKGIIGEDQSDNTFSINNPIPTSTTTTKILQLAS